MNTTDFCFIEYSDARPVFEEHGFKGIEILLRRHDDCFKEEHLKNIAAMADGANFTEFPPAQTLYASYCTACVSLLALTELTQLLNNN